MFKGGVCVKKFTKALSILLVLALMLPGFAFAEEDAGIQREKIYQDVKEVFRSEPVNKLDREAMDKYFKEDDEVRIIVELESKPSIVYATEKNVPYKELSNAKEIERQIEIEQQNVKKAILSNNIKMDFIHSFKTAFNGFSGIVKYKDIEKIEKLPSVKNVYIANEYERPEPNLETSHEMIGSIPTWQIGYEGEGTVIAIIDSGIDPSHRDMVLSEDTVPALTREDVERIIEEENLLGRYYTEKVPYGYNYYDLNYEIRDLGPGASEHGMHVAGIAAANGDVENGGVRGVAPEAQLLAMKVFSNDPIYGTTFSDIYLVAIDEAIRLGADVLNMSLGSTAGFYIPESAENIALTNATDNGIVCSVSAGNSAQLTYGWTGTYSGYPWKDNPDIGVVGAPGLNKDTIQVASIENLNTKVNYLTYVKNGEVRKVPMAIAGSINPATVFDGPVEYVDGGDGSPEYLENVAGKIALIVRGGSTPNFTDKLSNAQAAGAIGVIVRNHESGGEDLVNMATPDNLRIPAVFIGYSAGLELMALENKYVSFPDDLLTLPNPSAGLMSDFSSWGTTPSLELKPEITAPGGEIYSTLNNNKYGMMSGTSMAAPHVAGGAALVKEYIKENFENLTPSEQARLAKVLLMNTANIIYDEYDFEYSPRRQGAGLMNLYGAVTTPVRVVNAATNEAKVELKDFEDTSFTMEFKAINHSDTDATYNVDVVVMTDFLYPYQGKELNLLTSDYIYDATIDKPETITVPANGEITFEVTVDIGTDSTIYRNMFVEGFVKLIDPNDENPELSVPYVGFYGDWGEPNILDGMRYIDPAGTSYFNMSGMLMVDFEGYAYYYDTPGRIYMSPGTLDGFINGTDNVLPYLSFLRNAEYVKYNILDAEGNLLRTLAIQEYYRKDFVDGGRYQPVAFVEDGWWFGDVNGQILPDGDYFYEIEAKIHYDDAEVQSKRIPITIDTVAPAITNLEYNSETNKLIFNVVEKSSGLLGFIVYINDEEIEEVPVLIDEETQLFELDLSNYIGIGSNTVEILAVDIAYNIGTADYTIKVDNPDAYIYLLKPILLEAYNVSDISVEGYVTGFELLDKVLVDGVEADIEYMDRADIRHPEDPETIIYSGPAYRFTKLMTFEDGYREMTVEAISEIGSRSSVTRRFYVDTTRPELEVTVTNVDNVSKTAQLRISMYDNLGSFKLYLGDSQIYQHEEPLATPNPQEWVIDYTVNLKEGINRLEFTLEDMVGWQTSAEVVIDCHPVITNITPSEDISVRAGDQVVISFNAPTGGEGYYKIMLPFGLYDVNGTPMNEIEPGLYSATWTVPEGIVATNLKVEVIYIGADGVQHSRFAPGRITIIGNMEDLPTNAVIVDGQAYDIDYLNNNSDAQIRLIEWFNAGNEIYIKLSDDAIVNEDGELVGIEELPDRLIYFDKEGNIYIYEK